MPFTGKIGDTLRLRDTGARHRYIILTNLNDDGNVVILNFTTTKHFGWSITFKPTDSNRLFTSKCTPNYHDASLYPLNALAKAIGSKPKEYEFCPENLTLRIIIGAFQSRHTPLEIIDELRKQYPDEYKNYYKP